MSDWKWADIPEREKWIVYWGVMWRGVVVGIGFWLILFAVAALISAVTW